MILAIVAAASVAGGYITYVTGNVYVGCGVGVVVGILTMWLWLSANE